MTQNFYTNLNQFLAQCDSRDVLIFSSRELFLLQKLQELVFEGCKNSFRNSISHSLNQTLSSKCSTGKWFNNGEECEILRADSKGWQKGKIKLRMDVTLEFIPDEPEEKSPLDDVRQEIDRDDL